MTVMVTASCLTVVFALLCSLLAVSGQQNQCPSDGSPQGLRFVAQLNVRGCELFVHDTGASDGPHFVVEPAMCVTQSQLREAMPGYDTASKRPYVTVPVTLRDDAMLAEVESQLRRHLSPKSVQFATVSDISVSTADASSLMRPLGGILWSSENEANNPEKFILKIGCERLVDNCSVWSILFRIRVSQLEVFDNVLLSATLVSNYTRPVSLRYRLMVQNRGLSDPDLNSRRYATPPTCQKLRLIRVIRLNNCTARVHQKLDSSGQFHIEPLLCHNISSVSNESIVYDYSRDMYYLKLDVLLQDDAVLVEVRTQLADLEPRLVAFMRMWRAESVVVSALRDLLSISIGPLMVSADGVSAEMRVHCRTEVECRSLSSAIVSKPSDFWQHVPWSVSSLVLDNCLLEPARLRYAWRRQAGAGAVSVYTGYDSYMTRLCPTPGMPCKFLRSSSNNLILVIQQRLTGSVSFQRNWTDYERGFGDESDFWIGLSAIHLFSANGVTLRVEMKLWNGTELHAEYVGFKVGNASTNYLMTYQMMLRYKSSVSYDSMMYHNGMPFSTMDRDNDQRRGDSCSTSFGNGGWWFNDCIKVNPNGLFSREESTDLNTMFWSTATQRLYLQQIRMILQI